MGSSHIELEEFVTPGRVEYAYGLAIKNQHRRNQNFADTGYRAAIARDDKLLKVLELAANVIDKVQEEQMGRTMRSPDSTFAEYLRDRGLPQTAGYQALARSRLTFVGGAALPPGGEAIR